MKRGARIGIFAMLLGIATALVIMTSMAFLRSEPITVDYTTAQPKGQPVHLTLQTVSAIGFGDNPNWVSYLAESPQGKWVHSTLWDLPAHTTIDVTLYQYDSGGPLRNQERGVVQGVKPTLNGKLFSLIDSYKGNGVGHTFSIPRLGINVPLAGVNGNAKNFCNAAPCPLSDAHNTIKFSFTTPGPGQYRWQCFVPCGLGYLYGNGGPMSTLGYMGGFLKVVA